MAPCANCGWPSPGIMPVAGWGWAVKYTPHQASVNAPGVIGFQFFPKGEIYCSVCYEMLKVVFNRSWFQRAQGEYMEELSRLERKKKELMRPDGGDKT